MRTSYHRISYWKPAVLLFAASLGAWAASPPADPTSALEHILVAKGILTSADLAGLESTPASDRVAALERLLEQKGVLTAADLLPLSPADPPPSSQQKIEAPPAQARSKAPLTFYGTLLLNSFFNTAGANNQDIPLFATKQGSDPSGGDKNFGMTARQTRLGLSYTGLEAANAQVSGVVEIDFFGGKAALANGINMDLPRLRLAYGRMDWQNFSLEAGQDWTIFAPLNPTTFAEYAIPGLSTSGNLWIRTPQLRAEYRESVGTGSHLIYQLAASDPNVGDYQTATFMTVRVPGIGERGRMPAIDSRVALATKHNDRDYSIGLSGHYGHGKNFGTIGSTNVQTSVDSWGVALDYSLPVTSFLTFTGEVFEGRALGIFSGTFGEDVGAVGTPGQHGVEDRGGWAQAQFNLTKKWQANLAYGLEAPNSHQLPVGNRNHNQTYMGNIMYKISPALTWALEYRRFLTDFRNQLLANERGDHVDMAVAYMF